MRGGCAQGRIGTLEDLQSDLGAEDAISVAIVFGNLRLYTRYKANMGSLSELEVAVNEAGYNGFFLFFEDSVGLVEGFDSEICSGYNITFEDVSTLSSIDIFLLIDLPEVANHIDIPDKSKVVVFSRNLGVLASDDTNSVVNNWLIGVMSDVADYFFCPNARLNGIPQASYEEMITDTYPTSVVRGKSELCLISGGDFNLDYNRRITENSAVGGRALLIAPAASWHNSNSRYLVDMVVGLSNKFPSLEIIVRPYQGDESTFELIEDHDFSDNVVVDRGDSFVQAAAKSILMVSDSVSSIKTSYAFSNFKPVVEYAPEVGEEVVGSCIGYCAGSLDNLIIAVEAIVNDEVEQSRWRERLESRAYDTVANFGRSLEYFVEIIPEIAEGGARDDWVKVKKYTHNDDMVEEVLCRYIEEVYTKVRNPIRIVYCYRMIREGLKRYPRSPVMHYFAARAMAYSKLHPGFGIGEVRGEYYSFILKNYTDFFEQLNFELAELELMFDYLIDNNEGMDSKAQDKLLGEVLKKFGATPNGNEVVVSMLCAGLDNTKSIEEDYSVEEQEYIGRLERYSVSSVSDLTNELYAQVSKGLDLYPENHVVNYYAGKCLLYSAGALFFEEGRGEGYYYSRVLERGLEVFQGMNWTIRELVALLKYRATK